MKKAIKVMCLATLLLGIGFSAQAQFRQSVFLNLNIPTGSFASNVSSTHTIPLTYLEIGKDANTGFGLGYRISYRFDVGMGIVAPWAQADIFWNTISNGLSEEYTQARTKSKPTYFNIPLQLGITYMYDELWNDIIPYGEFGIGTDLMMITSEGPCTLTTGGLSVTTSKYSYKPNSTLSFSLGVGAYFGRHVSLGIYYYDMGKHPIAYTGRTVNNLNAVERAAYEYGDVETRTVGSVAIRIGFHF